MTEDLHKAIMKRSRLRNKILRDRTEKSRKEYKKQRNFNVNFLKILMWIMCQIKRSWQIVKPLFPNKAKAKTFIKLVVQNDRWWNWKYLTNTLWKLSKN